MAENRMHAALRTLTAMKQAHESDAAVYRSGSQKVSLRVTPAKSLLRLTDDDGRQMTQLWENDFFIPIADLVIAGKEHCPLAGDILDVTDSTETTRRYEISKPSREEGCARRIPGENVFRIHTKALAEVR